VHVSLANLTGYSSANRGRNCTFERNSLWTGIAMSDSTRPTAARGAQPARTESGCPGYDPSDFALRLDSSYRKQ